jgi:hypothetical protein
MRTKPPACLMPLKCGIDQGEAYDDAVEKQQP